MTELIDFRSETQPLAGQVALVTGSGRGLGRAYAIALAKTGASVVVTARTESEIQAVQREIEKNGGHALAISVDVTDKNSVLKLVKTIDQQLGHINLLVNNAGVLRAIGQVPDTDADDWWREIEINLRGVFLCSQAVLPGMITRKQGRIINLERISKMVD